MNNQVLRRWRWWHKWSSIVCTLFLLMLCVTGLPLIFSDEISNFFDPPASDAGAKLFGATALDAAVSGAHSAYPKESVRLVYLDHDKQRILLRLSPGPDDTFDHTHQMTFSAESGVLLHDGDPPGDSVMDFILRLHAEMLAGLPGELFLGLMGVAFAVAIVSGVVLYAPFSRRMGFGEIRRKRSSRLRWLDMHNLIGLTSGCWAMIVGLTGVMNSLATPLFGLWEMRDVAPILGPYIHDPALAPHAPVSVAIRAAEAALPGMATTFVTYPTHISGSPDHYVVWTQGQSKLRSRMLTPVLVDSRTGTVAFVAAMPWYLRVLEICRPLHFGDYGGLTLKWLWALLDVVTIAVLGSGVYLLFGGGRKSRVVAGDATAGEAALAEELLLVEGRT